MKRLTTTLILTMFLLSSFSLLVPVGAADRDISPNATEARAVLVELFTGASCGPCENADLGLGAFLDAHTRNDAIALVYHRPIPVADKLATSETATRHQWYSQAGTSAPNIWVDGKIIRVGGFSTVQAGEDWYEAQYDTRRAIESQLHITADGVIKPNKSGKVWVNVTALETPSISNLYLHTVVVRKQYDWTAPNGVDEHHYVVRKMLPSANGEVMTIANGETKEFEYTFDLSSDAFTVQNDMAVVAFVQTHTRTDGGDNRYAAEVLQSTYSDMTPVPNQAPSIASGQVVTPDNPNEDDDITFKVFYQDPDDWPDLGPSEAKVYFKNATPSVLEHSLSPMPSPDPWTDGKWVSWTTRLDPGTYTYRFFATDGFADATGDNGWNATQVVIKRRNKYPQLMSPSYAPLRGNTSTIFHFDIMYKDADNEKAVSPMIHINGVGHEMQTDSTGPWNDWVTYYYDTKLSVGLNHKYYYLFSDGIDEKRLPPQTDSPNWILGPEVDPLNNEPYLTTPMFSPDEGTRKDEFTITITYTDHENDHPSISYIYIDEVANIMDPDGTDYYRGETFRYTTTLSMGAHWIYFVFNDGTHQVRFPAVGPMEGPTVINMDPLAKISLPVDEKRYIPDEYIPFSAVSSTDPEDDDLTYEWVSDIDGLLSTAEAFDKALSEGVHEITLTVWDDFEGEHSTNVTITVKPYEPDPFFITVEANAEYPVETDRIKYTVVLDNRGEARASGVTVTFIVDGTEVSQDTININVGTPVTLIFYWTAEAGTHDLVFEIPGDSYTLEAYVDANRIPTLDPAPRERIGGGNYKVDETVYFDPGATDANDDDMTYLWDFGDGTTSTDKVGSHIYADPTTYNVTLKVTDSRGGVSTDRFNIKIEKEATTTSTGASGLMVLVGVIVAVLVIIIVAFMVMRRKPGAPAKDEAAALYGADQAASRTPVPRPPTEEETPEVPANGFPEYSDELDY